jgi:hypothetical protein
LYYQCQLVLFVQRQYDAGQHAFTALAGCHQAANRRVLIAAPVSPGPLYIARHSVAAISSAARVRVHSLLISNLCALRTPECHQTRAGDRAVIKGVNVGVPRGFAGWHSPSAGSGLTSDKCCRQRPISVSKSGLSRPPWTINREILLHRWPCARRRR